MNASSLARARLAVGLPMTEFFARFNVDKFRVVIAMFSVVIGGSQMK